MLDIVWRCDKDNKVTYVWFDTGLEYQATKDHLEYLKQKYNIEILYYKAIKPIPTTCRQYGQPFLSKQASEYISRLQKHNFTWEDKEYDVLIKEYPNCQSALQWWCNARANRTNGGVSSYNIEWNRYLKEFMIQNPPDFYISNRCCHYAKKAVAHKLMEEYQFDLNIVGLRKAEGGARSTRYKNCFDEKIGEADNYRPLFWYKNSDKDEYIQAYSVELSRCYTDYGLLRTGCAGCPYGTDFEKELEIIKDYEPKLYRAVNTIFGSSYRYTRMYREFVKEMKEKEKKNK